MFSLFNPVKLTQETQVIRDKKEELKTAKNNNFSLDPRKQNMQGRGGYQGQSYQSQGNRGRGGLAKSYMGQPNESKCFTPSCYLIKTGLHPSQQKWDQAVR